MIIKSSTTLEEESKEQLSCSSILNLSKEEASAEGYGFRKKEEVTGTAVQSAAVPYEEMSKT